MFQLLLTELRLTLRAIWSRRRVAGAIIGTLAMMVCGTVCFYPLGRTVILRQLPYPQPDELHVVVPLSRGTPLGTTIGAQFLPSVSAVAPVVWARPGRSHSILRGNVGVDVPSAIVSEGFFDALKIRPHVGRLPAGNTREAAITHTCWEKELGSRQDVLASPVELIEGTVDVVGLLPENFLFPWAGFAQPCFIQLSRSPGTGNNLTVLARAQTPNALTSLFADADLTFGEATMGPVLLSEILFSPNRSLVRILWLGMFALLVLAIGTLSVLLVSFRSARVSTTATLTMLGATRGHLRRLDYLELVVLAAAAALLGHVAAGVLNKELVEALSPLTAIRSIAVLGRESWIVAAVVTGCALLISHLTTVGFTRFSDNANQLSRANRPSKRIMVRGLLFFQSALGLAVLLVSVASSVSWSSLIAQDLGFKAEGLFALDVRIPSNVPAGPARAEMFAQLEAGSHGMPGTISVASIDVLPMGGAFPFLSVLDPKLGDVNQFGALWQTSKSYAETMGIHVLRGRFHTDSPGECVVSASSLPRLGLDINRAIGTPIQEANVTCVVVGIVDDIRQSLRGTSWWSVYIPHDPAQTRRRTILLRSTADEGDLRSALSGLVSSVERTATYKLTPVPRLLTFSATSLKLSAIVYRLGALGALLLVLTGVYGVATGFVTAMRRTFLIESALGADPMRLIRRGLIEVTVPVVLGLFVGGWLANSTVSFMSESLAGLSPLTVWHLALGSSVVLSATLLAAYIPFRPVFTLSPAELIKHVE